MENEFLQYPEVPDFPQQALAGQSPKIKIEPLETNTKTINSQEVQQEMGRKAATTIQKWWREVQSNNK